MFKPKEELQNRIIKRIQEQQKYNSSSKEIYYIRDRDTLIKHARIEKIGDEFTVYSITPDKLPAVLFRFPVFQEVVYTDRFNRWLSNKIYSENNPYCYDQMQYAQVPYYNKWLIFKAYSGRSSTDNFEIVDENDNFTFFRQDWIEDSNEFLEKVTKRLLRNEPIDQEVYNRACYPK